MRTAGWSRLEIWDHWDEEEGLFKAKSDECWARPRNAGIGDCVGHRLECMVFATVFVLHVTSSSSVH